MRSGLAGSIMAPFSSSLTLALLPTSLVAAAAHPASQTVHWWQYPNLDVPSLLGVNAVLRDLGTNATLQQL
eukprot:COSAG03_NODE_949_length_5223_cov_6.034543_5_plen_71_part_00